MRQLYELKYKPVKLYYYFFCFNSIFIKYFGTNSIDLYKSSFFMIAYSFPIHSPEAVKTSICPYQAEQRCANHIGCAMQEMGILPEKCTMVDG